MNNERKIKVSLAICISAIVLSYIFDLPTVNGAIFTITVDGKVTGLNPAFATEIIAAISVTYLGLCALFHGRTQKALGFAVLISVVVALSALGEYVLIYSHYSVYLPILLFLYFLVSISPFMAFFIYKFTN